MSDNMSQKMRDNPDVMTAVLAKAMRRFGSIDGLNGVDIGLAQSGFDEALEVRLHLSAPSARRLPTRFMGLPLQVIHARYAPPQPGFLPCQTGPALPRVMAGVGCRRNEGGACGQVGAVVKDRRTGEIGVLSTWQVLAGPDAVPGDAIRTQVQQPEVHMATLDRWMLDADGDAALAVLPRGAAWAPQHTGSLAEIQGARPAQLGEVLIAGGAEMSAARVDGIGIYRMRYELRPNRAETRDILGVRLQPLAQARRAGGAMWLDQSGHMAVGLQCGVAQAGQAVIACHATSVFTRLNVQPARLSDLRAQGVAPDLMAQLGAVRPAQQARIPALQGLAQMEDPRDTASGLYHPPHPGGRGTAVDPGPARAPSARSCRVHQIWRDLDLALTDAGYARPGGGPRIWWRI